MKKYYFFAVSILMICGIFISCGKKTVVLNEYGFYEDVTAAEQQAKTTRNDMIVIVTQKGEDQDSEAFLEMTKSDIFRNEITQKYTVLHLDFSKSTFEKTIVNPLASKAEQKAAELKAVQVNENSQFANLLNVQNTPAFYLLTADEYFVAQFNTDTTPLSAQDFISLLRQHDNELGTIKTLAAKAKTGSTEDKLDAIDSLYELTDYNYRVFLADLVEDYIKLDKNNSTGLLGKFIYADAENSAVNCIASSDFERAIKIYVAAAQNAKIDPQHKQQAYFMAGLMTSALENPDISMMVQYFIYAKESCPNGDFVEIIDNFINLYNTDGN